MFISSVFNMYALAETHVACVTTASPFLSCQLYIPSIIHISKSSFTLAAAEPLYPHHTDSLPRCDDGKKLGSNHIMRFICLHLFLCVNIFRLIACVNALTLTPLEVYRYGVFSGQCRCRYLEIRAADGRYIMPISLADMFELNIY